jgi:hypothetical protein
VYLTSISAEQKSISNNNVCDVLVKWTIGNQKPDLIEIYFEKDCNSGPGHLVALELIKGKDKPATSATIKVRAPTFGCVMIAPRMLDGTTLKDKQIDDNGVEQYWESFVLLQPITTKVSQGDQEKGCTHRPRILGHSLSWGAIDVWWSKPENYAKFNLYWQEDNGQRHKVVLEETHFRLERAKGGRRYTFAVEGCLDPFLWISSCCSEPSDPEVVDFPEELSYEIPKFGAEASLVAVARSSDNMDVFVTDGAGRVRSTWWDGVWHMWFHLGQKSFAPFTPVSALSRSDDFMDLFAVGIDGRVNLAWWNGNPWREWTPIGNGFFPQYTPVATLSRGSDFMDIFAVGIDGRVYVAWWNGNPWKGWVSVGVEKFAERTPIATLSRNDDHMEIFAVGEDGVVRGCWWDGQWHDWFRLDGSIFPQRAHIASLSRDDDHMDIFCVGEDGILRSNHWDGQWHGWYDLDGAPHFLPGTPITALSRHEDHMEIFAVAADNFVYGRFWDGEWHDWFLLDGHQSSSEFYPAITSISRNEEQMDVFTISRMVDEEFVWSIPFTKSWARWFILD